MGDFDITENDEREERSEGERKKMESSKFERELRKLECTVNYFVGGGEVGGEEGEGVVFAGLDEDSFAFLKCKRG